MEMILILRAANIRQMLGGLVGMVNVGNGESDITNVKGLDEFIRAGPIQKVF